MATQPPTPPKNGNGGESLSLSLGGRSVAVQSRDLISILMLCAGVVGGFAIFTALDARITLLTHGLSRYIGTRM